MITILMPIYNGIEFIETSVNSIINQTYKKWELIIGINGHKQNSEVYQTALKYQNKKINVLDLYNCKGKSNSLNEMIKYSSYNFIALLDVDDYWELTKLEEQEPYINKYDIVGTKCQYFGDSNIIPEIPVGDLKDYDFLKCNPIINSSCIIKKELCKWNSKVKYLNDYELWLRLWKQNKRFYNLNKILVKHRIHKQSAFNNSNHLYVKELIKTYS